MKTQKNKQVLTEFYCKGCGILIKHFHDPGKKIDKKYCTRCLELREAENYKKVAK